MISLLTNNKLNEHKNSFTVTYPRSVNIIFGNYPYLNILHNFILEIKNNLSKDLSNYVNVRGSMTDWCHFLDKKDFINFISYLINKYQVTHHELFRHFLEKKTIGNAWGNEIKKGDSLDYHKHDCVHGVLYLTKGCDLILPELNLKITPEPGDYYIFPPEILHGFDKYEGEKNRYSLVFNIAPKNQFKYNKKIREKNERQNS